MIVFLTSHGLDAAQNDLRRMYGGRLRPRSPDRGYIEAPGRYGELDATEFRIVNVAIAPQILPGLGPTAVEHVIALDVEALGNAMVMDMAARLTFGR